MQVGPVRFRIGYMVSHLLFALLIALLASVWWHHVRERSSVKMLITDEAMSTEAAATVSSVKQFVL